MVLPEQKSQGPQYRWEPLADDNKLALYLGTRQLGVYDQKTRVYRNSLIDGRLSEPTAPPWEKGQPDKVVREPAPPTSQAKAQPAEVTPAEQPEWLGYAAGAGVTFAVLAVGLMAQRR